MEIDSESYADQNHSTGTLITHLTTVQTDYFRKLAVELVIEIMKASPDFSTLLSLVYTSKRMLAIFTDNTAPIIRSILESSSLAGKPIPCYMQAILEIRAGTFDSVTRAGVQNPLVSDYAIENYDEFREILPVDRPNKPNLWRLCPPLLLRQFAHLAHLAHKNHVLSHMAMGQCIQLFQTDEAAHGPTDLPSPSWVAERRMVLAFWRLEFFLELKEGCRRGLRLPWSQAQRSKFARATIEHFFNADPHIREQVCTAVKALEEAVASRALSDDKHVLAPPFRLPRLPPTIVFSQDLERFASSLSCCFPVPIHPSWPGEVTRTPVGYSFVQEIPGRNTSNLCFKPFRRYGLFIWDDDMLTAMGLWPYKSKYSHGRWRRWERYFKKWKRLLICGLERMDTQWVKGRQLRTTAVVPL